MACARCHDHKFDPILLPANTTLSPGLRTHPVHRIPARLAGNGRPLRPPQAAHRRSQRAQEFVAEQGRQLAGILARDTVRYLAALRDTAAEKKPNWKKIAERHSLDRETLERWKYLDKPSHEHPFLTRYKKDPTDEAAREFQNTALTVLREKKDLDEDNANALAPSKPKRNAARTRLPNGFSTYDEFCPGCAVAVRSLDRDRYMLWSDLFKPGDKKGSGILYYGADDIDRYLDGPWKAHLARLKADVAELKRTLPDQYPYFDDQ